MMKGLLLALVLLAVYYIFKMQGTDLFGLIKNALTPCNLNIDQTLKDSILKESLTYTGSQSMNKFYAQSTTQIKNALETHLLDVQSIASYCGSQSNGSTPLGLTIARSGSSFASVGIGLAGATHLITAASATLISSAVLAPIGIAIGIVSQIFAAHAAKMAIEKQTICAFVPAANQSFIAIDKALASGQITLEQAMAELDQLESLTLSSLQKVLKADHSHCNAACGYVRTVHALVLLRKAAYQQCPSAISGWVVTEAAA